MTFSGKILSDWLIDGNGRPAFRRAMIAIEAGRIAAVGLANEMNANGPDVLDLRNTTLIPGLIDCHVHLSLPENAGAGPADSPPLFAERLCRYWHHGVMAVRDGGDRSGEVLRFRNLPAEPGRPRVTIFSAGGAFHRKGRYGGFIGSAVTDGDALADLTAQRAPLVDHIKIINSGLNSLTQFGVETPGQFTTDQLTRAVLAAKRLNRPVMVHANGKTPVAAAIQAGCASIEHGYFMGKENLQKMRDKQITWVPTAIPMKALSEMLAPGTIECDVARRTLDHQLEQMALARRLGVPVAVGTDAGSPGVAHGAGLVEEIKLFRLAGYTIEEAIRCASDNGARLIGSDALGRLAPGMPATFIAVPGPPEDLPESLMHIRCFYVVGELWSEYGA
ncbi:MAG: amidohydrolase family protein [Desulfobacterales bacterium]|jgi:imidazolonepropionase-like amidohydrolase|nr:amidohydrolase family protein [Desulfobacterales bacterium]